MSAIFVCGVGNGIIIIKHGNDDDQYYDLEYVRQLSLSYGIQY